MRSRRVVVTGMGAVCGAGGTSEAVIERAMSGRSAMAHVTRFDTSGHDARIAAEVRLPMFRDEDPCLTWGAQAADEAVASAGEDAFSSARRAGVFLGTALGSVARREQAWSAFLLDGVVREIDPFALDASLDRRLAEMTGASGPILTLNSAFAASADAIGTAMQRIRRREIDIALAGGAEAPITPSVLAGFAAMGALSTENDTPEQAIRPFDRHRNGCGLGEGAAFLVLEERRQAIARGATILAELAGYGSCADAMHITQLPADGDGLVRAMAMALQDAGIEAGTVDYINAHGTGTAMNDRVETRAIHDVFGQHAQRLGVSSTKPITGHMLGAAGAMEAVITIGALQRGMMPPTVNWTTRDPDCDLDYLPEGSREADLKIAMSNSMGFGGHNASLVFRAHKG